MASEMEGNVEADDNGYNINQDSCRICLKTCNPMCTIFERVRSISYAEMLRCVTRIRVNQDEDLPRKICIKCRAALERAFIFKVVAEKSDARLKLLKELDHDFSIPTFKREYEEYENEDYLDDYLEGNVLKEEDYSTDNVDVNGEEFGDMTKYEEIDYDGNFYISDANELELQENELNLEDNDLDAEENEPNSNHTEKGYVGNGNINKKAKSEDEKDKRTLNRKKCNPRAKRKSRQSNQKDREKDVCPVCGLLVISLTQHMQTHDERVLQCPECPKTFHKRRNLLTHLKYHSGTKNYVCSECGKSFYDRRGLNRHSSVHTGVKPYSCELCEKTFIAGNTLKLHMEIHAGTKRYKCETCGAHFRASHQLKAHSIQHTGEKPYHCQICNIRFGYKINLNSHVLKVHRVNLKFKSIKTFTQELLMDAEVEMVLQPDANKLIDQGDNFPFIKVHREIGQTIMHQEEIDETIMNQDEIDETNMNQEEINETNMNQEEIDENIINQEDIDQTLIGQEIQQHQVVICVKGDDSDSDEKNMTVLSMIIPKGM